MHCGLYTIILFVAGCVPMFTLKQFPPHTIVHADL